MVDSKVPYMARPRKIEGKKRRKKRSHLGSRAREGIGPHLDPMGKSAQCPCQEDVRVCSRAREGLEVTTRLRCGMRTSR